MRLVVLAVGLSLAAGSAFANETVAPSKAEPAKKEKLICKKQLRANSRFVTRQCLTKADWEAQMETARDAFAKVQNRPMTDIQPGN
jgi:hypothetical protein